MKKMKVVACVLSLLVAGTSYAAHTRYGIKGAVPEYKRAVQTAFKVSRTEEQFMSRLYEWAQQGDVDSFKDFLQKTHDLQTKGGEVCSKEMILVSEGFQGTCVHPEVLMRTDDSGNNLLHNAKDYRTLRAVEEVFTEFFPRNGEYFNQLKNKKNEAGETPLVKHTSNGDLGSFWLLYNQSALQNVLDKMNEVVNNPSELVRKSSMEIYKQEFEKYGADAAGTNIVDLVRNCEKSFNREEILYSLHRSIPTLFQ